MSNIKLTLDGQDNDNDLEKIKKEPDLIENKITYSK